ncbi:MAG: TraR/DksA C4-type zinc finger protein [Candidatus Omnitrophota bacterium]
MPNKKKMSKKDSKVFKDMLVKKKIELLRGLSHMTSETLKKSQREASGDLSGYTYHMADMASDVYERDFLLQLASGERELLLKIDDALRCIKDGNYGVCAECKKKITKTRLKAIPHTIHCRDCQAEEEKKK